MSVKPTQLQISIDIPLLLGHSPTICFPAPIVTRVPWEPTTSRNPGVGLGQLGPNLLMNAIISLFFLFKLLLTIFFFNSFHVELLPASVDHVPSEIEDLVSWKPPDPLGIQAILQHLHRHANLHLASKNKGHHSHHVTNHLGKRQLANLDPWIFSYFWTTKSYTNIVVNEQFHLFGAKTKSESCYFHETSWKSKELIFRNCLVGNELPLHLLFCGF